MTISTNAGRPHAGRRAGRGLRAWLAALGAALLLVTASVPAVANHSEVNAGFTIYRGDTVVAAAADTVECAGTACSVVLLHVGKRDLNRFVRACGDWEYVIFIEAGTYSSIETCPGGGSLSVVVHASLNSVNNIPQSHPSEVGIVMSVVAGAWGAG